SPDDGLKIWRPKAAEYNGNQQVIQSAAFGRQIFSPSSGDAFAELRRRRLRVSQRPRALFDF
ncbi:MAG: hypothetical protein K2L14_08265, partial [Duncaniella sp.]|nr:hypothetical protein [Duncaniella sp.]